MTNFWYFIVFERWRRIVVVWILSPIRVFECDCILYNVHWGLCVTCKLCQALIGLQPQNQPRLIRSNDSLRSGSTHTYFPSDSTHTHTHTHTHTWSHAYETSPQPYVLQCRMLTDSSSLSAQRGFCGSSCGWIWTLLSLHGPCIWNNSGWMD